MNFDSDMKQMVMILTALYALFSAVVVKSDSLCHIGVELQDASTETALIGARVAVVDSVGTCLADSLGMTLIAPGVLNNTPYDIAFYEGDVAPRKLYCLHITAPGYEPKQVWVKPIERGSFERDKAVYMRRTERNLTLDEVTVKATKIKMVMKGDTIVYDATAFRLPEGSMLDALIAELPGVSLSREGRITINGKFVKELMVNGRKFFSGNPQVALQNLPSYSVKDVKVYEKTLDNVLGGDVGHEEKELVMDVSLKREYATGWITNAEAGAGSALGGRGALRWSGRLFGTQFNRGGYMAAYASANNLNNTGKAERSGQWETPDAGAGVVTTKRAGFELSRDWADRTRQGFTTSVDVARTCADEGVLTFSEQYLEGGNVFNRQQSQSAGRDWDLAWKGSVNRNFHNNMFSIRFTADLDYATRCKSTSETSSESEGERLLYERLRLDSVSDNRFKARGNFWFGTGWIGKMAYGLRAEGGYENRHDNRVGADIIDYILRPEQNMHIRQIDKKPGRDWDYIVRANATRKWFKTDNAGLTSHLIYRYGQKAQYGSRNLRRADAETALPSIRDEWAVDYINSYTTNCREQTHYIEGSIYFSAPGIQSAHLIADATRSGRIIEDTRTGLTDSYRRNDWVYEIKTGLTAEWKARNDVSGSVWLQAQYTQGLPEMSYMLDVRDDSNPLNIRLGNPRLRKSARWLATLNAYTNFGGDRQLSITLAPRYERTDRALSMARSYDRTTGITITQPRNIDGNWQATMPLYVSCYLDRSQKLYVGNDFLPRFTRSVDFSSDTEIPMKSKVNNWTLADNFEIDYELNERLKFNGWFDFTWSRITSRSDLFDAFSFREINYGVGVSYTGPWKIEIGTDLSVYSRSGYGAASMNRTDLVWNLRLSRSLGKHFVVKATGFDLLQQLPTVKQEVNAQGRTETRYNSQPAYVMVSLLYKLDIQPKKK